MSLILFDPVHGYGYTTNNENATHVLVHNVDALHITDRIEWIHAVFTEAKIFKHFNGWLIFVTLIQKYVITFSKILELF